VRLLAAGGVFLAPSLIGSAIAIILTGVALPSNTLL
jgi:hypothetical protein